MASYLNELLARCAALEKEALDSISVVSDAKSFFFHTQESFPYFTNRIDSVPVAGFIEGQETEDDLTRIVDITARLVVAHLTEGYDGEPEQKLYEYLPVVEAYINAREMLQSAAYPTEMTEMFYSRCTTGGALRAFTQNGINGTVTQIGGELIIRCYCTERIVQAYL